ncbi:MAG: hypothetical protein ACRDMX_10490 [Solirubrobacteraceae bacterium]
MLENRTSFEDLPILNDLRDELSRAFVAHEMTVTSRRSRRRQRARKSRLALLMRPVPLIGSGAVLAGAALAAVLLASPATQPAYALAQNADGTVTVTINGVETAAPVLNAKFASMGIDERVVPVEAGCPSTNTSALFQDAMFAYPQATTSETFTFSPGRKYLDPGYTGVIAAEQLPNGEVAMAVEAIKPPVPSCFPTTVYAIRRTGTTSNGIPVYQITPTDPAATTTGTTTTR